VLETITRNPDLAKYMITFKEGDILFLEGDNSQDLYILISGNVDILKGNKKISEIGGQGSLFGEMSFLLGGVRTATAKACEDGKALRIPKEKISSFLHEFPSAAHRITKILAERLDETSQALYGLKEFCDQLPDAVVLTDKDGKILTWNAAAERLYGRDWHEMYERSLEEIYEEPQAYETFIEEVRSRNAVREKILKVRHPERGLRYISTSTTVLYDGHHNFQGVLSLGRDVTSVRVLERRYRRVRNWLIPLSLLLALLCAALFLGYPYFNKGMETVDVRKQEFRNELIKDHLLLSSLLLDAFVVGDRARTNQALRKFFELEDAKDSPYTGIVLLGSDKRVFDAFSPKHEADTKSMIGSSYSGIDFQGNEKSAYKVLVLYRADKEHPMGHRSIEVAFELQKKYLSLGWLVFQLDMERVKKNHGVTEQDLKAMQVKRKSS